jgi:hypothetical protein
VTRRALRLVCVWLGLPLLGACGSSRTFICAVDGVDVYDLQAPAKLGRLELVRLEAYLESESNKAIVIGCERAK